MERLFIQLSCLINLKLEILTLMIGFVIQGRIYYFTELFKHIFI